MPAKSTMHAVSVYYSKALMHARLGAVRGMSRGMHQRKAKEYEAKANAILNKAKVEADQ